MLLPDFGYESRGGTTMSEDDHKFPGTHGWEQFLANKLALLAEYDRAKTHAQGHKVQVHHGRAAEAAVRSWLEEFLPKRFGVTSGYLVSQGQRGDAELPHFDVIIYDMLESPVLWIESTSDNSTQGGARAIPVEHVHAVFEVKARLTVESARNALQKLEQLRPFAGQNQPDDRYPKHLNGNFCCGVLFFELQLADGKNVAPIRELLPDEPLPGYLGGLVLMGDGHERSVTGRVLILNSDTPLDADSPREYPLFTWGMTKSKPCGGQHRNAMLIWAPICFSQFVFDVLASMQGRYDPSRFSSFHGMPAGSTIAWKPPTQ